MEKEPRLHPAFDSHYPESTRKVIETHHQLQTLLTRLAETSTRLGQHLMNLYRQYQETPEEERRENMAKVIERLTKEIERLEAFGNDAQEQIWMTRNSLQKSWQTAGEVPEA
jgi:chromosome segregation ATPase